MTNKNKTMTNKILLLYKKSNKKKENSSFSKLKRNLICPFLLTKDTLVTFRAGYLFLELEFSTLLVRSSTQLFITYSAHMILKIIKVNCLLYS